MKLKYIGLYLFPLVLPLPLPMVVSTIALFVMIANLLVLDYKNINIKETIKNPLVILCLLFFGLDFIRAVLTMSFDGKLIHEVRIAFTLIPLLFLNKESILMQEFRNILKCFIIGVFGYILTAWGFVFYYYTIEHPTYVFDFTDYFLRYVLAHEFPMAMHHTYIGMYIALSAIVIFINTIHYRSISVKKGIPLVGFLFVNSFFLGSKISMGILFICIVSITVMSVIKASNFKKIKYYLAGFIVLTAFGMYSVKEWLFFTLTKSFDSRVDYFKKSMSVLQEHFLMGIGKDALLKTPLNAAEPALGRLIPHNMFIYETIVNGLLGLIVLIILLTFLTRKAIKTGTLVMVFFMLLIITTGLVEDTLMRQRGVFFFIFFASLFYIYTKYHNNSTKAVN